MRQSVNLFWKMAVYNVVVILSIFVVETKIIFDYNFGALLDC